MAAGTGESIGRDTNLLGTNSAELVFVLILDAEEIVGLDELSDPTESRAGVDDASGDAGMPEGRVCIGRNEALHVVISLCALYFGDELTYELSTSSVAFPLDLLLGKGRKPTPASQRAVSVPAKWPIAQPSLVLNYKHGAWWI